MNRLVIIGNGFDLAHGLPTSYGHFIDDFWRNIKSNYLLGDYKKIIYVDEAHKPFDDGQLATFDDLIEKLAVYENYNYRPEYKFDRANIRLNQGSKNIFRFENDFFKKINIINSQNWVDIENEYYKELKKIANYPIKRKEDILKLNDEFDQVKKLLEDYLEKNVNNKYDFYSNLDIKWSQHHFAPYIRDLNRDKKESEYLKEFPAKDHQDLIDFDNKLVDAKQNGELEAKCKSEELLQYNYFLNFNYTNTIDAYVRNLNHYFTNKQVQIQIHGKLNTSGNEVNLGFGDEMDDHYEKIENINDNEYLKNFKSFQYSQNSNYKKLLDYIDSGKFQIYIMGHSCGLSDRTLLNTVFEHKNCRSIKVFYHKREDGTDNYTEIIQNISRHFNKKSMMREKIVNKSLCEPLEKNIRFTEFK